MRRLARLLFTLCSAVSLVLCVAACVLWVRSWSREDRAGAFVAPLAGRYTVSSHRGGITLFGPPPALPQGRLARPGAVPPQPPPPESWPRGPSGRRLKFQPHKPDLSVLTWEHYGEHIGKRDPQPLPTRTVDDLCGAIDNDQLVWEVEVPARPFPDLKPGPHFTPRARRGTPTSLLAPREPNSDDGYILDPQYPPWRRPPYGIAHLARPLLAAMEDPDRWVAAHAVLAEVAGREAAQAPGARVTWAGRSRRAGMVGPTLFAGDSGADTYSLTEDGLRVELSPAGPTRLFTHSVSYGDDFTVRPCSAIIDPAQRATIRDQWHRRLDVPLASVPHAQALVAVLFLPLFQCAVAVRRRLRRGSRVRRGLCPACGYDLRASPGRCPECGMMPLRMP